ncbi:MAG: lipase family protein [Flavobacterium sp. JAD_PAG50586_2]|nr:MAG: lipase family protein [Flavobacterium sp. JAD_PAG50586_2]
MRENLYKYINAADWNDTSFSVTKAYVCAKFSQLIYEYKPTSLNDRTSFYDINDETLRNYKNISQFNSLLSNSDMNLLFIAEDRHSVTVGISAFRVVIVASRGTAVKKDWLINLNFPKNKACKLEKLNFHRGFHNIALKTLDKIHKRLAREDAPVCFTGHSLGGALTGILYFYFRSNCNCRGSHAILKRNSISAYTFGMPMFSNKKSPTFDNLYHIYNQKDIVPAIPPKSLKFQQNGIQYEISVSGLNKVENHKFINFKKFIKLIFNGKVVKEHVIENYIAMLQNVVPK